MKFTEDFFLKRGKNVRPQNWKVILCFSIVTLSLPIRSQAQFSNKHGAIDLLEKILDNFSGGSPRTIFEDALRINSNLSLKVEVFAKNPHEKQLGFDSIQHIFKPSQDSVDNLTLSFLNENYFEKNALVFVQWTLNCSYRLENAKPSFSEESIYQLTLSDIQKVLGKFEKERIPRKASNRCTFFYTNPKTRIQAVVAVDCFLPCDNKEGNTINSIDITFQSSL